MPLIDLLVDFIAIYIKQIGGRDRSVSREVKDIKSLNLCSIDLDKNLKMDSNYFPLSYHYAFHILSI